MEEVAIPISDGRYGVVFPDKCVYCGAPSERGLRETVSKGRSGETCFVTVDAPYCPIHARQSKGNTRILNLARVVILLSSCAVMFGVTTSINRTPPVWLLLALAFAAAGLAFVCARVLRKLLARSNQSMADMLGQSHLGLNVDLAVTKSCSRLRTNR
jgi:hypothetical protein